jgi:hypothetical protein
VSCSSRDLRWQGYAAATAAAYAKELLSVIPGNLVVTSITAIPKAPYQRPRQGRIFCDRCNDYPEGFRGAHDLGRHQDRSHRDQVRKWVCVEPANSVIRPVNPLSKCKAYSQQKKNYGTYFNAAAHLRRAHFKPKARGRGECPKVEDKSEKRGGKGGDGWPLMSELKLWMKEVYEHVDVGQQQEPEEDEDDEEGNGFSGSSEIDDFSASGIRGSIGFMAV